MQTHVKPPKLSEGAKKLQRELESAKSGAGFAALEICLRSKLSDVTAVVERQYFDLRKRLLPELANLRDDGLTRLSRTIGTFFRQETDLFLLNVRRDLRRIWHDSAPVREKQVFVDSLITSSFAQGRTGWGAPLALGRIVLDPKNLRSQVAVAILENWRRFRVCANPECVAPFFLARRKDQKYCERGACTGYAQRMYSSDSYYRAQKKERKRGKRGR